MRVLTLKGCILALMIATGIVAASSEPLALEDHLKRSGKAGREISVTTYVRQQRVDCSFSGYPSVVLGEPPEHGTVCLRIRNVRVTRDVFGSIPHCVGRMARGVQVIYLPRSDFAGTEKIQYTVLWPRNHLTVWVTFNVSAADLGTRDAMPSDIAAPMPEVKQSPGRVPSCAELVS